MNHRLLAIGLMFAVSLTAGSAAAQTVMSVSYGTISGINVQERDTSGGRAGGALVGGLVGLATGRGRSTSNQALRTLGGAAAGSVAGGVVARGTETVYTVNLIDGGTVRVVMDSGRFQFGDCVAVEQGGPSANLRRVSAEFCRNNASVPAQYKAEQQREADACAQAKQRLLEARTEEDVRAAGMVVSILCED